MWKDFNVHQRFLKKFSIYSAPRWPCLVLLTKSKCRRWPKYIYAAFENLALIDFFGYSRFLYFCCCGIISLPCFFFGMSKDKMLHLTMPKSSNKMCLGWNWLIANRNVYHIVYNYPAWFIWHRKCVVLLN